MAEGAHVAYYRVSTAKQGASGLGLDAQKEAVEQYLNGGRWTIVAEFTEVESGKKNERKQLAKAIKACRLYGAKLVIAKLDRLSRNAHFLLGLKEAGVDFVAADMPTANRLTVGILAMVAEEEGRAISARTKAALEAKKKFYAGLDDAAKAALVAKGKATSLGGFRGVHFNPEHHEAALKARAAVADARASDLAPVIDELRTEGVTSLHGLAKELTKRGIPTARGGSQWSPMQVSRVLERIPGHAR